MTRTAVILDERYTRHEMGIMHPETPRRLGAVQTVLDGDGVGREVERIDPREATRDELAFIHDERYIERIAATAGIERTILDPDTSANAHTWEAAAFAAGGTLRCTEEVLEGRAKNAFAFVRPPGHHAERDHAMGFCFFNNIAIAAEWLIREKGLSRVAIVDFDVHHGNGTQHAFERRPDVFFASIHRHPFFPGTGAAEEVGLGEGQGYTLNIPFSGGAGDEEYRRAFEEQVIPSVVKYKPEFILSSAGFDSHVEDPIGGMRVTTKGYRLMMRDLVQLAGECCDGRLAVVLEGGYDLGATRECAEAQLEEMVGAM